MEYNNINQSQIMQAHIDACKLSSKTVTDYCQQHQLKVHQYYYWQKKLLLQKPGKFISITPVIFNAPVSITFINGKRICFEAMPPVDYVQQLMS